MKKYLLSLIIALSFSAGAFAQQTIEIAYDTLYAVGSPTANTIDAKMDVENTGTSTINVHVEREVIQKIIGTSNLFCWGVNCYPPSTDVSNTPEPIDAGGVNKTFKGQYYPTGTEGYCTVKYCFYEDGNEANQTCVIVVYQASTATGIDGVDAVQNKINLPSPNPASGMTAFTYTLNQNVGAAYIQIANITGQVVKTVELNKTSQAIIVNVDELNSGIYTYAFVVDGKTEAVNRLVVNN